MASKLNRSIEMKCTAWTTKVFYYILLLMEKESLRKKSVKVQL
jgi:hypothetical protein